MIRKMIKIVKDDHEDDQEFKIVKDHIKKIIRLVKDDQKADRKLVVEVTIKLREENFLCSSYSMMSKKIIQYDEQKDKKADGKPIVEVKVIVEVKHIERL